MVLPWPDFSLLGSHPAPPISLQNSICTQLGRAPNLFGKRSIILLKSTAAQILRRSIDFIMQTVAKLGVKDQKEGRKYAGTT